MPVVVDIDLEEKLLAYHCESRIPIVWHLLLLRIQFLGSIGAVSL